MKTRWDLYRQEAASLLRDITMYRALTKEQALRLYPGKREAIENLLVYLEKQKRVRYENGAYLANEQKEEPADRGLSAAVWVLADFIDRVEYHSIGDYPAKVIFVADGEVYEVLYAEQGKETLLSNILSAQSGQSSRYLMILEDLSQIEQLPPAFAYCTVAPDGTVQYYKTEPEG